MMRPQRQIVYFATAMSLVNLGDTLFYVVVPTYYTHLGLIPFQVGILLSVNRWIRLATNHLVEYGYRRYPSDLWLLGAFFLGSVVCTVYGFAATFFVFLVARVGWGIAYSLLRQAGIMNVVSCSSEKDLAEQMGYFTGINALWRTSGLFLGALCHDVLGFAVTFIGLGILSLLSLPLGRQSQKRPKREDRHAVAGQERKGTWSFVCFGTAMGLVGGGMIFSTLGLVLKTKFGGTVSLAGFAVGAATVTGLVMGMRQFIDGLGGPFLGAFMDRIGRERAIGWLFLAGSGLLFLVGLQSSILGLVALITMYFMSATALYTVLYAQAGQSGPRAVASFATAMDLGMSIGPMIGWGIAQFELPLSSIFMTCAFFYGVGAAVAFRTLAERRKEQRIISP
jgi:predicted MFS family arabinose efflux permease